MVFGFLSVLVISCSFTPGAGCYEPRNLCVCFDAGSDASPCPIDAPIIDAIDAVNADDAPQDAGIDAPPDALACTLHSQCVAQMPGTCCVNPGPTGYCATGIVIGGVCDPQ